MAAVLAVLGATFVRTFLIEAFRVPSSSMEETLLPGDYILVNRFLYGDLRFGGGRPHAFLPTRGIRRGDVVVFKYPRRPELDFVKRCLGLPGETVALAGGRLLIDGRPAAEPYLGAGGPQRRTSYGPRRIPGASYFCLGDNRDDSSDSREWGPVAAEMVRGRATLVYWSVAAEKSREPGEWSMIDLFGWFSRSRWERFPRWIR